MTLHANARTITLFLALVAALLLAMGAQAGFPDGLRRVSDRGQIPFRIGTTITLQGGPSLCPVNGYQLGLLSGGPRDREYRALVRG